jgi:hypothetical protein
MAARHTIPQRLRRVAPVLVVPLLALAAGCSSDESDDAGTTATTVATTSAPPPATTLAPPADGLHAFGATSETWYARHAPVHVPKLNEGCCFEPLLADGRPSITETFWLGTRIVSYSIRFDEPVPLAAALRTVRAQAPAGAKLVYDVLKSPCRVVQYAHPALEEGLGPRQAMGAALYSSEGEKPFDGSVLKIVLAALPKGDKSLRC